MTNILITGAGGFVGSHLIKALQKKGDDKVFAAVYHSTSDVSQLLPEAQIIEGDLTDYAFAEELIKKTNPDVIYHLAALAVVHSSAQQATKVLSANLTLQYNILEAVRLNAPNAKFIAIASANAYGLVQNILPNGIDENTPLRPLNPYAVSKVAQEMLALQYHLAYGLNIVILRPFNHTGPGQTTDFVVPSLACQIVEIEKRIKPAIIQVGNLDSVRDFTDVEDIVNAYILAATFCESGEIYNIGSGTGRSIQVILDEFQSLSQVPFQVEALETLNRKADVPILVANADKFKKATGWSPTITFKETLSRILEYERNRP